MSSILGRQFRISTWGESHGPALGVVIDGCPAGLELSVEEIQVELDKRRPGQNKLTTARKEGDVVEILSGVFEGKTTGTPISLIIQNTDQRSHDYGDMVKLYRPSHADLSYDLKYGFRDYRGGGRSSARETAARVAAGAVAKKILNKLFGTEILSWVEEIAGIEGRTSTPMDITSEMVEAHPTRCPVESAQEPMAQAILAAKKDQDSVGGVIRLFVKNTPIGLGEPVFDRVESLLAHAMMSIPATKGFEIGSGFAGTQKRGSEHNDPIYYDGKKFKTTKNDAGGTLGGISYGGEIDLRVAFKATATISQDQETCDQDGKPAILKSKGRHDPCVVTRAPIIAESMAALVLVDLYLEQNAKAGLF